MELLQEVGEGNWWQRKKTPFIRLSNSGLTPLNPAMNSWTWYFANRATQVEECLTGRSVDAVDAAHAGSLSILDVRPMTNNGYEV